MRKTKTMHRALLAGVTVVAGLAIGCSGKGGGGGIFGSVVAASAPNFKDAPQADLSGQDDVFKGTLGSGTWFTFTAAKGVTYNFAVSSKKGKDEVVIDIFNVNGGQLKGKALTTNGSIGYLHDEPTQHVLVLLRPAGPVFDTSIEITQCRVSGFGPFDQNRFNLNFVVRGETLNG
jgi:hypothetical protein